VTLAQLSPRRSSRDDTREIAPATARPGTRPAPKRSKRRGIAANLTVMGVALGLVATVGLPAYAMTPGSKDVTNDASDLSVAMKAGEQEVTVDDQAATITVARDGYAATSKADIDAAAAAAAAATARQSMTAYSASYSGPSVSDFLANPPFPGGFDLASVYNVALQYQGVPYVYGGNTPAGFDCSGFVQYVYAQFGVRMPHSSTGQGAMGTRISLADAQPGDLVIMDGPDGFYAGNGNILHAPYEGASVRVQPLWTTDYYIVRIGI
jgi:cell wall-associated NlpC family hydrolase